jgi:hypothetical protein
MSRLVPPVAVCSRAVRSRVVGPLAVCAWLCAAAVAGSVEAAPALAAPISGLQLSAREGARSPSNALGGVVAQEPEWGGVAAAPQVAWRFQAAAPASAAPAVSDLGAVYLSTVEGYVHALAADGGFRWSYGVAGVPIGEPALDPTGHVYVTTTARRVYSIRTDGHLQWERHTPSRIASAAVWSSPGQLSYAARDQSLYALSVWGEPLWNVGLGKSALLAPASLASGGLAVATEGAELRLLRGSSLGARLPLPGSPTQPVLSADDRLWVVSAGEVLAFETQPRLQVVWRAPACRAALSADGQWLLVESEGELTWRAARSGELRHRVQLPEEASAAPALTNAGVALIPLVSGELLLFAPGSSQSARVRVGPAPLWRPLWDEARRRVLVSAGSGTLVAIDLGGWPTLHEQEEERHFELEGAADAALAPRGAG